MELVQSGFTQGPELGFRPGMILRLCGMRRSGNHAITSWLQRNGPPEGAVFLNNCVPGREPVRSRRAVEVNGSPIFLAKNGPRLAEATKSVGDGGLLIVSYEDVLPDFRAEGSPLSRKLEPFVTRDLIAYRSFVNWCASMVKKVSGNPAYGPCRQAAVVFRAIDRYQRVLASARAGDRVGICYDRWVDEPDYRVQILGRLGLAVRDNALGTVQRYGGGSSFENDTTQGEDLRPAERWQDMADDPQFINVLEIASRDDVLLDQIESHFPDDLARIQQVIGGHS